MTTEHMNPRSGTSTPNPAFTRVQIGVAIAAWAI
jgi:hypothetical protein